jgi:hypothetical protein
VVSTRGALALDAPGSVRVDGTLDGAGASWSLGSGSIGFIGSAPSTDGLQINSSLTSLLRQAGAVRLASGGSIELMTPIALGADSATTTPTLSALTLIGTSLNNRAMGDSFLGAGTLTLAGTGFGSGSAPSAGAGSLTLVGSQLDIGPGTMSVSGFSRTQAQLRGAVIGTGTGGLSFGGDLTINAAEITAASSAPGASDSQTVINVASGTLQIGAPSVPSPTATLPAPLGGSLALVATSIEDAGSIFAPGGLITLSAGDLHVAGTAVISAAGRTVQVLGQTAAAPGGVVTLTAGTDPTSSGNLSLDAGARIDVSGAGNAPAGELDLTGNGTVTVSASLAGKVNGTSGGRFALDAGRLGGTLTDLAGSLQAGGFTGQINVRARTGDLALTQGSALTANQVTLTADAGKVDVSGLISAPSGDQRGNIGLYGGTGVTLEPSAFLQANGSGSSGRGGEIVLDSACPSCAVTLDAGSAVSAFGAAQMGTLLLRAPVRGSNDVAINVGAQGLKADVSRVGQVLIEAVKTYTYGQNGTTAATVNQDLVGDISAARGYLTSASSAISSRLSASSTAPVNVQAGVEIQDSNRSDTVTLHSLDLSASSQQGQVIDLTVRAAGSLTIDGTISDGFDSSSGTPTLELSAAGSPLPSGSLRFVAGADLSSANPLLAVRGAAADLKLAGANGAAAVARTGTGDLDLVASRNIVFAPGSSAYTAGLAAAPSASYQERLMNFATDGGNLLVHAGGDISATLPTTDYSVAQDYTPTAWLIRVGNADNTAQYGVDFAAFDWNIGALGGGDVAITAGGKATNLTAATADSLVSATTSDGQTTFTPYGTGGGLTLTTGGSIGSSQVYVADGVGTLTAGGGLVSSLTSPAAGATPAQPVGSAFALANSQISVWARQGILVESAYNPSDLTQQGSSDLNGQYFTYGAQSALRLESTDGTVTVQPGDQNRLKTLLGHTGYDNGGISNGSAGNVFEILPASLSVQALQGDFSLRAAAVLYPSSTGQLQLFAARDIGASSGTATVSMSDNFAANVPTAASPTASGTLTPFQGVVHLGDSNPALITAGRDIKGLFLSLPKAAQITAGRDIVNLIYAGQNTAASDVTLISAGRDVSYVGSGGRIGLGGPGTLDLLAGRNVDLGVSQGITTEGNLLNANLPTAAGAAINLLAGLGTQGADYARFLESIIVPSPSYQAELQSYVESQSNQTGLGFEQARTLFSSYSRQLQLPLIDGVFFNELLLSGREANAGKGLGFTRGYAAIDALFPNSRTASAVSADPYSGNLSLISSQIYTLSGGTISLLTPGGSIDVGLANPPAGVTPKKPSQLGIVAQGSGDVDIYSSSDVNVNASRIFTLGGGNILIWSNEGSIDAGRGSKASLSVPPPIVLVDTSGNVTLDFGASLAGSGIRTIQTEPTFPAGSVDLIAPVGTVNAGDAGIGSAGNINIAAAKVIGVENINFGGTATGVPAQINSLGASLSGVAAVASSATSTATSSVEQATNAANAAAAPLADAALGYLEVFVIGLGEEDCKPDDTVCLQRQKRP